MPTPLSIEEVISNIRHDPKSALIETYIEHLTLDEIDKYFFNKYKDDTFPFLFYIFSECNCAARKAMLYKLKEFDRLDVALNMADQNGNKLLVYILREVSQDYGRYRCYPLLSGIEISQRAKERLADDYLSIARLLANLVTPVMLAKLLTEKQNRNQVIGLEFISAYGEYYVYDDHLRPLLDKADKEILSEAVVKYPQLLTSLNGVALRNHLASSLTPKAIEILIKEMSKADKLTYLERQSLSQMICSISKSDLGLKAISDEALNAAIGCDSELLSTFLRENNPEQTLERLTSKTIDQAFVGVNSYRLTELNSSIYQSLINRVSYDAIMDKLNYFSRKGYSVKLEDMFYHADYDAIKMFCNKIPPFILGAGLNHVHFLDKNEKLSPEQREELKKSYLNSREFVNEPEQFIKKDKKVFLDLAELSLSHLAMHIALATNSNKIDVELKHINTVNEIITKGIEAKKERSFQAIHTAVYQAPVSASFWSRKTPTPDAVSYSEECISSNKI